MREFTPVPKPEPKAKLKKAKIAKRSTKRAKQEREYAKLAKEYLSNHLYCEMKLPCCTVVALECHHMKGRDGALLTDTDNFMAACAPCHAWVTENSKQAIEMGLSISRLK
jgi:hypothetical protein